MPDEPNEQGTETGEARVTLLRSQIRELEAKAKKHDESETRATKAERELAFFKAGVDMDSPMAHYFVNGYSGDLTVEAIKSEAEKVKLLKVATPPPVEEPPEEDAGNVEQFMDQRALDGIRAATGVQITKGVDHRAGMKKAIDEGGPEAMVEYMRRNGLPVAGDDQ